MYETLVTHREIIMAMASALATFCGVLALGWPYLARHNLTMRMRQVVDERERTRLRAKALRNEGRKRVLLRSEPMKIFAAIVERSNITGRIEDGAMIQMLRIAGFRGRAPVITFLGMRLLMPVIMLGVTAFYIFVVIKPELPVLAKAAIVLAFTCLGYYLPTLYVKNRITNRQKSIKRHWPDALDLLLICVESGMSSEHAFRKVASEIGNQSKELAEELSLTTAELSFLPDRRVAYENLANRTNLDSVKAVVLGLIQSEKYGTSLGHVLRVLAQESRDMRMSEAEKKAAALPPKLTVPMILFFLPVLFAVIITPAVIQIINN